MMESKDDAAKARQVFQNPPSRPARVTKAVLVFRTRARRLPVVQPNGWGPTIAINPIPRLSRSPWELVEQWRYAEEKVFRPLLTIDHHKRCRRPLCRCTWWRLRWMPCWNGSNRNRTTRGRWWCKRSKGHRTSNPRLP